MTRGGHTMAKPKPTRTTRMPAFWGYPPLPHDYPYYWVILDRKSKQDKVTKLKNLPKVQILEFWNKRYMRHTLWSCLIRCVNIKWIRQVLLKIQSGHDSVHRRTKWNQYTPLQLRWARGIMMTQSMHKHHLAWKANTRSHWWWYQCSQASIQLSPYKLHQYQGISTRNHLSCIIFLYYRNTDATSASNETTVKSLI